MKGMAYHGWKLGLPDKFWPVTLDDFFDNPDEIREFGLRCLKSDKMITSSNNDGKFPGIRSEELWKIDEGLNQTITEKILSCYFNLDVEMVFWNMSDMRFQLISSLDKDKNNTKNKGWIHRDGVDPLRAHYPKEERSDNYQLAGLIYLTPDIERDTGTSLFNMKEASTRTQEEDQRKTGEIRKQIHLGDPVSDKEAEEQWKKHRSCFIEKVRFENIYNRLIMYDANEFHAANSFYTSKNNRLTLGFFIGEILANKWPLERVRQWKEAENILKYVTTLNPLDK